MLFLYNLGITLYSLLVNAASLFNDKAKLFVQGRKNVFEQLQLRVDPNERPIWFHFASLGEFEQGRPVLEKLKEINHNQQIVVTFFSPSGYEIRKNYALANVFYLPIDTRKNAKKFVDIVNPKAAIFTKYEFWHHYFTALSDRKIPLFLISGIFRPEQAFFKWYGGFYRGMLKHVHHFFVQNQESISLLQQVGIKDVTLAGDTRFDRVYENAQHPKTLPLIAEFCGISPVFVAGSTWLEDEKLLVDFANRYPDWKMIIAPHEIGADHIIQIETLFPKAVKFSSLKEGYVLGNTQILIIDNIGMLSSLYAYAKVAYIGGGFGAGIHNTLEAAAFGLPVIFGPKYEKFQEAKDLIGIKAAESITNAADLISAFEYFESNSAAKSLARDYVAEKKGATDLIIKAITTV